MVLGLWFQNISTTLFLVILEKRASRSLAKSGLFTPFCGRLFSRAFSAGRQHEIFQFSCVFRSLEGALFGAFLDDGKRFYSEGRCIPTRSENWVGVWGRVRARSRPDGSPADDGKRFSSDGRCICRWVDEIEEWGGV